MNRCCWANTKNEKYISYHDNEWGKVKHDDKELFEALVLECFQAGLSWEIILNKRESFREAFDDFDYNKIINYDDIKVEELLNNSGIIRHRLKIASTITNAKIFMNIQEEFGTFSNYIWGFTNNKVILNEDDSIKVSSEISDKISKDLKKRGMKFVGTKTIYSYLQAIGIVNDHEINCDFR